jgi:hypothetical protein
MTADVVRRHACPSVASIAWAGRFARVVACSWPLWSAACTKFDVDEPWGFHEVRHVYRMPAAIPTRSHTDDDYAIVVPMGVQRRLIVLAARDALRIGKNVRLFERKERGNAATIISSTGELHVGRGARIGAVYGMGDQMSLEDGVILDGYGKSVGRYFGPFQSPAIVDRVAEYAEEFQWKVDPPAAPEKVTDVTGRSDNSPLDVPPGAYGTLLVESGSITRLRAGSYFFDALLLSPNGILQIDNASGSVYIWAKKSLSVGGTMLEYADYPSIFLGYSGTQTPSISAPLRGTLVAPNASITLPATREPHRGAVFARSIYVDDDAEIESCPFAGWEFTPEAPSLICSRCAIVEASSVGACCDDFERRLGTVRAGAELCGIEEGVSRESSSKWECAAAEANDATQARLKLRECIMSAEPEFTQCEENSRFREDTCENLGYGLQVNPECTE